MQRFLFLFLGAPLDPEDRSPETGEYMRRWGDWTAGLAARGALESGLPLDWSGRVISREGQEAVRLQQIDVGGYMVVRAGSMEQAVGIAGQAPNVALGGKIVIRPCLEIAA